MSIKKNCLLIAVILCLISTLFSCSNLIVKLENSRKQYIYTVKHFQQNLTDDEYTEVTEDEETLSGKAGELTKAQPKEDKGFTAKEITQQIIARDGSTVVGVYYDRNIITYTFYSEEGVFPDGETISVVSGRYGATVNPDAPKANHQSYLFDNWGEEFQSYFDASNKSFYAKYKYNFYETPVKLPEGTDGKSGVDWTYVYFGVWPQTIKAESIEVNENESITMGGNIYYLGSDKEYYVKCLENGRNNNVNHKYSDGTRVLMKNRNSYKYFKVEPLKWRVVTPNYNNTYKSLLLAESVLTSNVPYYGSLNERRLNNKVIYSNNYKYSNIRAYLNGIENQFVTDGGVSNEYTIDWTGVGFLQTAFTVSAQEKILETEVDNSLESTFAYSNKPGNNSYICDNTFDKIFCLSLREVTTPDCGFFDNSPTSRNKMRQRYPTDYAKANYNSIGNDEQESQWFLRSPRKDSYEYAYMVHMLGEASNQVTGAGFYVTSSDRGVVPALVVALP